MHPRSQGLPTGPRSSSRSRYEDNRHHQPMHPQKSLSSLRNKHPGPPPPTQSPRSTSETSSYRGSDDSMMSSASSFMDRIRAGTGYASSRTSLDSDEPPPKTSSPAASNYGFGDGSAAWNSVATAASSLTVNVSKAWASNITVLAGEETPPGSESRLTRAMKAYHLEKCNSPADLPAFLFDEHERRVVRPSRDTKSRHSSDDGHRQHVPTTSRGLRGVYQAAAESTPSSERERTRAGARRPFEDSNNVPSTATDRLKAMRNAKRTVAPPTQGGAVLEVDRPVLDSRPPPRVGLPSGPGRRRY